MNTEQITPENLEAVNASDNLMWYHTPQDFLDAITSKYPCPALSSHERAYWLYQCREAARWIAGFINEEYRKEISSLIEQNTASKLYEIISIERPESRVNISLMRQKYPELFEELVSVKASDAAKILGKKTLYDLVKEKIGDKEIRNFEYVTVGDVARTMLAEDAAELIETRMKTTDSGVQEKDTS